MDTRRTEFSRAPRSAQLIVVDADTAGQRLDNFLVKALKGLPKSRIYRIIRRGEVRINGGRCKPGMRLRTGDRVRVPPIRHLPERVAAVGSFLDPDALILHQDEHLLVIDKPAGMAVHGGSGVSAGVIESLRRLLPDERRLELAHRLDRGTSGCLMVARRRHYLRLLQEALRRPGRISKRYVALVHGRWPEGRLRVAQPLLTLAKQGRERVTRVSAGGRVAVTRFQLLATTGEVSLVHAWPLTGRTHQIRVHARWLGHPLVGDERYGDERLDHALGAPARLMLHAAEVRIPALGEHDPVRVRAPLDKDFQCQVDSIFGLKDIIK